VEPRRFDDLTKALATPASRRRVLRRIGGTLTGAILASLLPGRVLADNSACAHFCASVFGADTPAANQCISDAAHGTGLCYTCGPASPSGTQPMCCSKNTGGTCTSYRGATCCPSGSVCSGGQCINMCTDGIQDGQETDTDCGGPNCPRCGDGQGCLGQRDCQSSVCVNGRCAAPTCTDHVKNGLETDTDCGGPDCPRCGNFSKCLVNSDCISGLCLSGVCQST
jgi:hypothetical protein